MDIMRIKATLKNIAPFPKLNTLRLRKSTSWPVPISPKHKTLDIHQCWPGLIFFLYHSGIYNEDIAFLILKVWKFDDVFHFDTIWVYILCKNLHTEAKLP